jgi:hypothetical protein
MAHATPEPAVLKPAAIFVAETIGTFTAEFAVPAPSVELICPSQYNRSH